MDFHLEAISYHYRQTESSFPALNEISLSLTAGECVALVGPSGAGKTTLAQILNGLLQPDSGQVHVTIQSQKQNAADLKNLRRKVGLVFQFPEHQFFESTVTEEVAFAALQWGIDDSKIDRWVGYALQAVGLDHDRLKSRNPLRLSGGEARLVSIASLLVVDPEWLILDEPTLGLDFAHTEKVVALIQGRKDRLRGTFLITHDLNLVLRTCPRTIVLNDGQVAFDGPTSELFFKHDIAEEFDLIEPPLIRYSRLLQDGLDTDFDIRLPTFQTGQELHHWIEAQPRNILDKTSSILKHHLNQIYPE